MRKIGNWFRVLLTIRDWITRKLWEFILKRTTDFSIDCSCQKIGEVQRDVPLEEFKKLRKECPALNKFFVPDCIWTEFQQWHQNPDKEAHHRSMLLLALKRGQIGKVTSPIHRYLLKDGEKVSKLNTDYKNVFVEKWFLKKEPLKRHERSKGYTGKLAELKYAEWLESQGWEIVSLEAWCGSNDITAKNPEGLESAIEVKYIGQENKDFDDLLKSIQGETVAGSQSLSSEKMYNYALYKIYAAAKQLSEKYKGEGIKIAVIIISHMALNPLSQKPFNENWLEKQPYRFMDEPDWQDFYKKKVLKDYPNIERELSKIVCSLSQIKIMKRDSWELSELKIYNLE